MMKKALFLSLSTLVSSAVYSSTITEKSSEHLQTSYSFGYLLATGDNERLKPLDLNAVLQGFSDAYKGKPSPLSKERMVELLLKHEKRKQGKPLFEFQQLGIENAAKSKKFMLQNARQVGIKRTASGLQYQILKDNPNGKLAQKDHQFTIRYEGRLTDDTVFDSSIARDESVTFSLPQLIKGLQEGLLLMKEGQTLRFFIPPELAYQAIGSGKYIEPNVVVVFDVELLSLTER